MKSPLVKGIGEVVTDYGTKIIRIFKKGLLGRSLFDFYGDIKANALRVKESTNVPTTPFDKEGGVLYVKSSDGKLFYKSNEVSETDLTSTAASIGDLTDVDLTGTVVNHILVFDGSKFKTRLAQDVINTPAIFTFTTQSFSSSDLPTATQLVGASNTVFKAAGAISFAATYFPDGAAPNDAKIQIKIRNALGTSTIFNDGSSNIIASNLSSFQNLNSMTATAFTSGSNSFDIKHPEPSTTSTSTYPSIQFQLSVQEALGGSFVNFTTTTLTVSFANKIFSGVSSQTSLTESQIEALSQSSISTGFTSSTSTLNAGSGEFLYRAVPARYADYHINYTNSDGTTLQTGDTFGFTYNGITCPFIKLSPVSVRNSSSFVEDYDVFKSVKSNLGSGTIAFSTSSLNKSNTIIGITKRSAHSDMVADDLKAASTGDTLNTNQTFIIQSSILTSVTGTFNLSVSSGHSLGNTIKVFFAFPDHMTNADAVKFNLPGSPVGGFSGGNSPSPHTLDDVENANGFLERYRIYISDNTNILSSGTSGTITLIATT